MKFILKNNSSDSFSYLGGTVSVAADSTTDIPAKLWFPLYLDLNFLKDLRDNSFIVSDGIEDLTMPKSEEYIEKLISLLGNKDSDGSPLQRVKITTTGWNYQLHGLSFETSTLNSIYSQKSDGTDYNFTTIKCYDENGQLLETQENCDIGCVKTVIDWEPTHDYEIIGGMLKQISVPDQDIFLWIVGIPDVPAQYGGSKEFVSSVNIRYIGIEEGIKADGRASKYLSYSAQLHTNKMRIILNHPVGYKHKLSMIFEIFKP